MDELSDREYELKCTREHLDDYLQTIKDDVHIVMPDVNSFKKYLMYVKENGKIVNVNPEAFELANEAFKLFKQLYDCNYGSIEEDENLIEIHTGGWSENEALIEEFKQTGWWFRYHKITAKGGHYFFNMDFYADKEWKIVKW